LEGVEAQQLLLLVAGRVGKLDPVQADLVVELEVVGQLQIGIDQVRFLLLFRLPLGIYVTDVNVQCELSNVLNLKKFIPLK
jgi:hypothetical protein